MVTYEYMKFFLSYPIVQTLILVVDHIKSSRIVEIKERLVVHWPVLKLNSDVPNRANNFLKYK